MPSFPIVRLAVQRAVVVVAPLAMTGVLNWDFVKWSNRNTITG